jgi:hypothetical protein
MLPRWNFPGIFSLRKFGSRPIAEGGTATLEPESALPGSTGFSAAAALVMTIAPKRSAEIATNLRRFVEIISVRILQFLSISANDTQIRRRNDPFLTFTTLLWHLMSNFWHGLPTGLSRISARV